MWSLRPEHFKMIYACRPPRSEQVAIVRFLDHADRRIRRYIRAKQKLIKLLEEQRQAIIHRAVTRGLDANVRLKPSEVEWLGDVPEHWDVSRLGRHIELLTGFAFKSEGFTAHEDDIRLLRGVNIAPGRVRWQDVVRWPKTDRHTYAAFELGKGDIVLGMDRPIIQGGIRVAVITDADLPSLLLQRVARIRPAQGLRADFLRLILAGRSLESYLNPIFTGVSVPHVSPDQVKSFPLALPGLPEQGAIIEWVEASTSAALAAGDAARRDIALIRELRTRLIADVVTGKLDVREAATRLPEVVEEPVEPEELNEEIASENEELEGNPEPTADEAA